MTFLKALAATAFLLFASAGSVAGEDSVETVYRFAVLIPTGEIPNQNGDGTPVFPNLFDEDTIGIAFGRTDDTGTALEFAAESADCESVPVAGTVWPASTPAVVVRAGAPVFATSFGGVFGTPFPENTFLNAGDLVLGGACWIGLTEDGKAVTQVHYDDTTIGALFIMFAGL